MQIENSPALEEPGDASPAGDEALDLLDVAGGAAVKRLVPVALLIVAVVAVLILVLG